MATQKPAEVNPKQLEDAQEVWAGFLNITKWSIVAIVIVLILLAIAFIQW